MFWRIYLYGMLLLVVVAAASVAVHRAVGGTPHWQGAARRFAAQLGREFGARPTDLARLESRLQTFHQISGAAAAVYTVDGTRLGAAGHDPPSPLSASSARSLRGRTVFHRGATFYVALPLRPEVKGSAYLAFHAHTGRGFLKLALTLLAILLALALVSIPLARSIARPVEKLTATARQLARGDLAARAGLDRKDEVGVLGRTIDEMAAQLEHRIRTEKELLANVSHEIRTPLARIRVALELCSDDRGDVEKIKSHLDSIGEDIGELDRLVEDVLVAARLDLAAQDREGPGIVPRRAKIRLSTVARQAGARFAQIHPNHTLRIEIPDDLPELEADGALVRRVLDNLLDNAAEYSEPDRPVSLTASAEPGALSVSVRDRGIGVAPEDLARLFDPFFRTDRSRGRRPGGTGLGLSLCKRIVEAHGGGIVAEQNPEGGTVIRFTLPLADKKGEVPGE